MHVSLIRNRNVWICTALATGDRSLLGAAEEQPAINVQKGMLLAVNIIDSSLDITLLSVWGKTENTETQVEHLYAVIMLQQMRCHFWNRMLGRAEM